MRSAVLTLVCLAFPAVPALACQCGHVPSVEEAIASADAAFVGTVVEVWPVLINGERHGDDSLGQRSTLRIDRRLRGAARSTELLFDDGGNCSFRFARGESYLVFGRRCGGAGRLAVDICSPTRAIERLNAAERAAVGLTSGAEPPTAAPESLIHLAARRLELARLVAAGTLRSLWRSLADSSEGLALRLALPALLGGAASALVILLRRRRFLPAALWFVAVPAMIAASLWAWGWWLALENPWFAALAR